MLNVKVRPQIPLQPKIPTWSLLPKGDDRYSSTGGFKPFIFSSRETRVGNLIAIKRETRLQEVRPSSNQGDGQKGKGTRGRAKKTSKG